MSGIAEFREAPTVARNNCCGQFRLRPQRHSGTKLALRRVYFFATMRSSGENTTPATRQDYFRRSQMAADDTTAGNRPRCHALRNGIVTEVARWGVNTREVASWPIPLKLPSPGSTPTDHRRPVAGRSTKTAI